MRICPYLFVAILVLTAGCASVPMSPAADDATAKLFQPPASDASIYIFRDEGFIGAARTLPVLIDGRTIGATAPKVFFLIHVAPGRHTLASTEARVFSLELETEAGRMYFVRHVPHVEILLGSASGSLELVSAEAGRKGVLSCKRSPNLFSQP